MIRIMKSIDKDLGLFWNVKGVINTKAKKVVKKRRYHILTKNASYLISVRKT